jgi:hypothetical protein
MMRIYKIKNLGLSMIGNLSHPLQHSHTAMMNLKKEETSTYALDIVNSKLRATKPIN